MQGLMGNLGVQSSAFRGDFAGTYHALLLLGNGFIITALLWSGTLAFILDGRLRHAALLTGASAVAALIGLIHSPYDNGRLFLPWDTDTATPWMVSAAYLAVAAWLWLMNKQRPAHRS
jgi:AGZA family xanthine/uracil permease-like MFS transporter